MNLEQILARFVDLQMQLHRVKFLASAQSSLSSEDVSKIAEREEYLYDVIDDWKMRHFCSELVIYHPKENGTVKIVRGNEVLRLYDLIGRDDKSTQDYRQGPTILSPRGCVLLPNANGLDPNDWSRRITTKDLTVMDEFYEEVEGEEVSFERVKSGNNFQVEKIWEIFQKDLDINRKYVSWFNYRSVCVEWDKRSKNSIGPRGKPLIGEDPVEYWDSISDFYSTHGSKSEFPFALDGRIDLDGGTLEKVKSPFVLFPNIEFSKLKATIAIEVIPEYLPNCVVRSYRSSFYDLAGQNDRF